MMIVVKEPIAGRFVSLLSVCFPSVCLCPFCVCVRCQYQPKSLYSTTPQLGPCHLTAEITIFGPSHSTTQHSTTSSTLMSHENNYHHRNPPLPPITAVPLFTESDVSIVQQRENPSISQTPATLIQSQIQDHHCTPRAVPIPAMCSDFLHHFWSSF